MPTLTPGQRLGPYEVMSSLGAGGMGEVYQALDTRLHRTVAIKVSREQFSERFEREARAVAALNHPNICTLYDVGPDYLVMELVEGPTLAERIAAGAIPLDESLRIARQIGDALEAAHEQGIVHRDLKPANVKIKPDGLVKVLDFGLAKVGGAVAAHSGVDSPTISMAATQAGVILGTASYMSPEQARGKPVDKRADIWAFGVVLYEMVAGRRLFDGEDVTETLATVIKGEPKWDGIPANVQRLVKTCLEKDPKHRLRDIGDAWRLLEEAPAPAVAASPARTGYLGWIAAAVLALALGVLSFFYFRIEPPATEVIRFNVSPPENESFAFAEVLVSPDGRKLAFISRSLGRHAQLWVRSLDSLESRPVPGAEDIQGFFWSADSRYIGATTFGKLRKLDLTGGPVQSICELPAQWRGGTWNRDGVIIFGALNSGLWRVSAAGGAPAPVTRLDPSREVDSHSSPDFLPDGRHFLYQRLGGDNSSIYIGSLDAKPEDQSSTQLLANASAPVYAPPAGRDAIGHLLFGRGGSIMAQAFDARRLELVGEAVLIAEGAAGRTGPRTFSVSRTGVLTYRTGANVPGNTQLSWFDRQGKALGTVGEPRSLNALALSPDGTRVAVTTGVPPDDIWVHEFARGTTERLTSDPAGDWLATWSPDGSRIVFSSDRGGKVFNLYQKASSGAGSDELLLKSAEHKSVLDWSRDGRFLLYAVTLIGNPTTRDSVNDVWVLPLTGFPPTGGKPEPYLNTQFNEGQARFSPDGSYVAYRSDASGRDEIYVQPFPVASGGKWTVSRGGGLAPRWRADGKELFYVSPDNKLMAVEVTTKPAFSAVIPKTLFQTAMLGVGNGPSRHTTRYDVTADGTRFLINSVVPSAGPSPPITVVVNWTAMLKQPAP